MTLPPKKPLPTQEDINCLAAKWNVTSSEQEPEVFTEALNYAERLLKEVKRLRTPKNLEMKTVLRFVAVFVAGFLVGCVFGKLLFHKTSYLDGYSAAVQAIKQGWVTP